MKEQLEEKLLNRKMEPRQRARGGRQNSRRAVLHASALLLIIALVAGCTKITPTPSPTVLFPTETPTEAATPSPGPPPTDTPPPAPPGPLGLVRAWKASTTDTVWALGTADVEGDGKPEVWAASYDHNLYLLDGQGNVRWSYTTVAPLFAALAADLDGDGHPEFVVGGDDNQVHLVGGDGAERWSFAAGGRVTHLATGDVDGDGQVEVVAATWDGVLHIVNAAGQEKQRFSLEARPTSLLVADLDLNRTAEIVVGTEAGQVQAMSATGQVSWQHGMEGSVRALWSGDVDGDGSTDLVAGSRDGLVAMIGADGTPRWGRRIGGTTVTLAGLPGEKLIVVGQAGGLVTLNAADGSSAWLQGTADGVWSLAYLPQGNDPTIVAGTDGGQIILYDRYGQLRGQTALPSRVHGLAAVDLDGNGQLDVLARSGDHVYAFAPSQSGEVGEEASSKPTLPRWPNPSPLDPPGEGRISLVAVGDIMLSRSIEERAQAYSAGYPFDAFSSLLSGADVAVGNLECALTQGGEPSIKTYAFRAHPSMAAGLAAAGIDVVSLANNHTLDYGLEGLDETIQALESQGVHPVGAGPRAADPVIVEAKGIRIAFLARNTVGDAVDDVAFYTDEQTLRQDVQRARGQADLVVLLLHAGDEYSTDTTDEQRQIAHAAVEAGAALVIGAHSHVLQGTEQYGAGMIAYGLGDFVFDIDIADSARDGAALRAILDKGGVVRVDRIDTRIVNDVQPRPLVAPGGRVAMEPLLINTTEPLPAPPTPRDSYRLTAQVDPDQGQVGVQEQIVFPNATGDTLKDLSLYVFPNAFPDVFTLQQLEVVQDGQMAVPSYSLAGANLHIFLPGQLPVGGVVTVSLAYSLSLPALDPLAWPPGDNIGVNADGRAVHLGHWYPQLVPYQRGYGWQTWEYHGTGDPFFSDLADYQVTVEAPSPYTVIEAGEQQQDGERWTSHLDNVRDFFVLVGRDYQRATTQVGNIQVVSAYRSEHERAGQAVLSDIVKAVTIYQQHYGPYPYPSFTIVEGDMNGGMEYGSLVLVGAVFYESYQGEATAVLPGLAVHELSHQWWYDVVGNDQVHEPWLDEALARYSEVVFYENAYPDVVSWWWQNRVDQWNPSGPVDVTIYDYEDPGEYVHMMYGQGAHFIQALRDRMGDKTFFTFLQRYYRENAWKRVTANDFFRMVSDMGVDISDLRQLYFK